MKKILYSIMAVLVAFSVQSCDSLDLAPEDYNASGNYWQSESQVNNFMIGLHNNMRSAMTNGYRNYEFMILGETRGALITTKTTLMATSTPWSDIINNNLSEDITGVSNWADFYSYIMQVNKFISEVENGCDFLSADARNYYLGIAYGMRSYYYFWLYRTYGGVPIELTVRVEDGEISAEKLYLERSSAEATLQQIKSDVEKSITCFNETSKSNSDFHYWSKDASLMLKGEVYLWSAKVTTNDSKEKHTAAGQADLQTAKQALEQISGFSLAPDFSTLFSHDGKQKKNNPETILAIYYDKDEATNLEFSRMFVYHNNFNNVPVVDENGNTLSDPLKLNGGGLQYNEYRQSLVDSYDKTDSRRAATFLEYWSNDEKHTFGCSMKKYVGQTTSDGNHYFDADIILYRYADVLLMLAEIENGLGNYQTCADKINEIRKRAYGPNYPIYDKADKASNELAILKERDKEFVGEGKRWFDLLRLQDANGDPLVYSAAAAYADNGDTAPVAILNKSSEEYKLLWPINTTIMTNDPQIKQTYGYKSNY